MKDFKAMLKEQLLDKINEQHRMIDAARAAYRKAMYDGNAREMEECEKDEKYHIGKLNAFIDVCVAIDLDDAGEEMKEVQP